ncbi:fatty acid desaturase [Spongiibacter taiwanensis]|uniref:fatty acid desaturase n=1 Tax=Spongiibacter taiwanensis TaxID=1748242 RepID=UPI00203514C5|nr:fatty acid desaturase [Spongiibacter taiwanensis]USA42319.1 fatty acid desaturase [Spongiibacter taiwanensis]
MTVTTNQTVREVLNQITHDPRYKDVMKMEKYDIPQTLLTIASLATFILSCYWYLSDMIPWWLAIAFNIVAVYLAFTPMHDASHRAVSSDNFVNDLLGTAAGQILLPGMNMPAFRAIHMDHHRYVGQEGRDPDCGLVNVPKWAGLSYLMFTDIHWLAWFFKNGRENWSPRIKMYVYVMMATVIGLHAVFLLSPYWAEFLLLYVVPQRLGLGLVAYTFAHIQHPHGMTWENEPFQSTVHIDESSPLRGLMFGQENHHIHHLLPHLPWYRYRKVWDLANGILEKQPIPERGWLKPSAEPIWVPGEEVNAPIEVKVYSIEEVGEGIRSFVFEPTDSDVLLPEGAAGAHVNVFIKEGLIRQYSLVEHDDVRNRYRIAVKCEENGRGGSKAMHQLEVGQVIKIGRPKNNFMLYENAKRFVLISGGIGITPMLAMAHRLIRLGKDFELHVCARNEEAVPFKKELSVSRLAKHVHIHLDQDNGRSALAPETVLANPSHDTQIYICGPGGFMNWLRESAVGLGWHPENIRIESFAAPMAEDVASHPFTVHLAKSNKEVEVKANQSIIDALQHSGVEPSYACMQGTCGTCITGVVDGEVDHRDAFLSETEKAANDQMCLCVSRAKGDRLSLDL